MAPTTVAPAEGRGKRRMPPLPRPRSSCPRQQQRTGRRTCLPPTSCTRTRSCPLGSPRRSKLSSRFPATRLPGFRAITRIRTRTRARGRMRASGVPPQAPQGDGEDSQGQFYIPGGKQKVECRYVTQVSDSSPDWFRSKYSSTRGHYHPMNDERAPSREDDSKVGDKGQSSRARKLSFIEDSPL